MPTKREREYYSQGFFDGRQGIRTSLLDEEEQYVDFSIDRKPKRKVKRKLSAWNKFVKANSKKPRFRYRNGKLNLKKMAVAFRKTPAGKKKRR